MSHTMQPKKKRRSKALLPIMGLALAILLGVVAYMLAPLALKGVGSINEEWRARVYQTDNPLTPQDEAQEFQPNFDYLVAGVLWVFLLGFAMMLVAAATGPMPEKETLKMIGPSPADKKAYAKQLKKDLRAAKKRAKQRK